ncbi:leucine-rich_repeat domain-containing protein [Hexamita inflata]|uniref:Leucine-rich repeat domain-containing protein n=1 Tax=Hexamita inflata TaxID=28002 RepID=A0AA86QWH9_9EUKA|nr:leucine-rich repeat domain-containing protein [Hexamita inflata]
MNPSNEQQLQSQINFYNPQIESYSLKINDSKGLDTLQFIQYLNIYKLQICGCPNLIQLDFKSQTLYEMYICNSGVQRLDGIQFSKYLQQLCLANNKISSLSGLEQLQNLQHLDLSHNTFTQVTALKQLSGLKTLNLSQNYHIEDFTPLSHLSNLQRLNIQYSLKYVKQDNMIFLSNLFELRELNLSNDNISSIQSLKKLTKLKYLYLSENKIVDLSPLMNMVNLVELNLSDNRIVDVLALQRLEKLQKLNLYANDLTNIDALSKMVSLQSLNLQANHIVHIQPLRKLNIKQLNLLYNRLVDIEHVTPVSIKEITFSQKQNKIYQSYTLHNQIYSQKNKINKRYFIMQSMIRSYLDIMYDSSKLLVLIEQLFQQVCGRRLIELRGLFYVINFVETKQCQACQYFHFAPNKNNANNE